MSKLKNVIKIGLFGAAPDTSNMGVSALFASTVEGLTEKLPNARFIVFDNKMGKRVKTYHFSEGNHIEVEHIGIRSGHRYYLQENIMTITLASHLGAAGSALNYVVRDIDQCDVILDISGGDSFSDIYGVKRFMTVVRPKLISLIRQVPLILLPQTYGPYARPKVKKVAAEAVKGADMAWARDPNSFEILKTMLGDEYDESIHKAGVDFAFGLGVRSAEELLSENLNTLISTRQEEKPLVGLNISGLIYNDPDAAYSQYGFKADYREIIHGFCDWLLKTTNASLVIIPHVMAWTKHVESDYLASQKVAEKLGREFEDRVHISPDTLDQNQVKWVISKMDWSCGTRMHSTIAALSQGVATSSIAYSDKTAGVFATCGQGGEVFDPRKFDTVEIIEQMKDSFLRRKEIEQSLGNALPQIKEKVENQLSLIANRIEYLSSTRNSENKGK